MKIKEKESVKESYQDLGGKPFEDLTWNRQKKKKRAGSIEKEKRKRERKKEKEAEEHVF